MIKPPINPWTPPIPTITPGGDKPNDGKNPSKPGGSQSPSGAKSEPEVTFESLFEEMLKQYLPETVEFTPLSEDVLRETIQNWLRPAYEQAIQNRRDQTQRINAELDADAWSRGMGASTYLSDVKERQYRGEQRDVDTLEGNYASTLAGHLYDAMKEQQNKKIEVDEFNAEQINHARELAVKAARELYEAYLAANKRRGSGGGKSGKGKSLFEQVYAASEKNMPKTNYGTAEQLLGRMSPEERRRLYNQNDPKYLKLRSELTYSLGRDGFSSLKRRYLAK